MPTVNVGLVAWHAARRNAEGRCALDYAGAKDRCGPATQAPGDGFALCAKHARLLQEVLDGACRTPKRRARKTVPTCACGAPLPPRTHGGPRPKKCLACTAAALEESRRPRHRAQDRRSYERHREELRARKRERQRTYRARKRATVCA